MLVGNIAGDTLLKFNCCNSGGTPSFEASGNYYDVHLDNDTDVSSLTIEFSPATEDTVIYFWDGGSWLAASDQYYDSDKECIVVSIAATTLPILSDLTRLVFGSGLPIIQSNESPVADPDGPYNGSAGIPVQFDSSSSYDPDGIITSYEWDFGDGTTGSGPTPTHTYTADGTYTVTLTVADDDDATNTASTGCEIVTPTEIAITIDIKPGSDTNSINL